MTLQSYQFHWRPQSKLTSILNCPVHRLRQKRVNDSLRILCFPSCFNTLTFADISLLSCCLFILHRVSWWQSGLQQVPEWTGFHTPPPGAGAGKNTPRADAIHGDTAQWEIVGHNTVGWEQKEAWRWPGQGWRWPQSSAQPPQTTSSHQIVLGYFWHEFVQVQYFPQWCNVFFSP